MPSQPNILYTSPPVFISAPLTRFLPLNLRSFDISTLELKQAICMGRINLLRSPRYLPCSLDRCSSQWSSRPFIVNHTKGLMMTATRSPFPSHPNCPCHFDRLNHEQEQV